MPLDADSAGLPGVSLGPPGMAAARRWAVAVLPLAVPLLSSAWRYYPITRGYFRAEDFFNLFRVANAELLDVLLMPFGGHLLATRNAVWAGFQQVFGPDAPRFFAAVLATHLLNVVLLYRLVRRTTGSVLAASFGATMWGTASAHAETLGWYAVYGHVLVAVALLVLLGELHETAAGRCPGSGRLAWWCVLLLAASTSFGIGVAVVMSFPVVAALWLPASVARRRVVVVTTAMAVAMGPLYFGLIALHAMLHPEVPAYSFRVALEHWWLPEIFAMRLMARGLSGLLLGSLVEVVGPETWLCEAVAIAAVGALAYAWPALTGADRRRVTASVVLAAACYAIVAAGRSYFLTLPGDHLKIGRWQYVAQLPLAVVLCVTAVGIGARWGWSRRHAVALFAAWIVFSFAGQVLLPPDDGLHHEVARAEVAEVLTEIQRRVRASPPGGLVVIPNRRFRSVGPMFPMTLFPGWAGVFVIFGSDELVDGRRVVFAEPDAAVIEAMRDGKRTVGLLTASPMPPPRSRPQDRPSRR